jgi:hypothetical protein
MVAVLNLIHNSISYSDSFQILGSCTFIFPMRDFLYHIEGLRIRETICM